MRRFAATLTAASLACGGSSASPPPGDAQGAQAPPPPESEAPVALNPDTPIAYPAALFEQNIDGEVVLRLFADSTGRLIPESTRVAESSNYPALDSAALAGSVKLRFAPAKRRGIPVATAFLQPVEFLHRGITGTPAALPAATVAPPQPQRVTPPPTRPAAPPPVVRSAPRPDSIRPPTDTTRRPPTDTTRRPVDTIKPPPPPPPTDTTSARPDTSAAAH